MTGDVVTISNGLTVGVTNLSRDWARTLVDVPLPLGVDVARTLPGKQFEVAPAQAVADPDREGA